MSDEELARLGWIKRDDLGDFHWVDGKVLGMSVDELQKFMAVHKDLRPGNIFHVGALSVKIGQATSREEALPMTPVVGSARQIAMPPGHTMEQTARWVFFFARKCPRVIEETIGDYRFEMIEAEARGKSQCELRMLRVQHWGGFILCVIDAILTGIIGRIWRAPRGG